MNVHWVSLYVNPVAARRIPLAQVSPDDAAYLRVCGYGASQSGHAHMQRVAVNAHTNLTSIIFQGTHKPFKVDPESTRCGDRVALSYKALLGANREELMMLKHDEWDSVRQGSLEGDKDLKGYDLLKMGVPVFIKEFAQGTF